MNKILLGLMLLSATSFSYAEKTNRTGWIVGASVGTAVMSIDPKSTQYTLSSNNEMAPIATVYSGFNFTDWFGIEFDLTHSSEFTDANTNLDASIFGTSFAPKFTYHINDNLGAYMKAGVQYIAYEQSVDEYYDDEITWNDHAPLFGAGLQYNIVKGLNARIDYKYSKLRLEKTGYNGLHWYGYSNNDKIDLTYNAITVSAHYQF